MDVVTVAREDNAYGKEAGTFIIALFPIGTQFGCEGRLLHIAPLKLECDIAGTLIAHKWGRRFFTADDIVVDALLTFAKSINALRSIIAIQTKW